MPGPVFGHIQGYPVGSRFESRAELADAGVHRHRQAGISGSASEGADSVVLSGGYQDDQDFGDLIIYTGYGGRDPETKRQIHDQPFSLWNRALAYSSLQGLPVRVIRGEGHDSSHAPTTGYRYDGLYLVDDYWQERGRSGFLIWRYRLIKVPDQSEDGDEEQPDAESSDALSEAPRRETTGMRIVRDTAQARRIKELYDYQCQMCGTRLECLAGPYAEAAHIRPLGAPHRGPDTPDNILCLCPNHHVLFDHGGVEIGEDLSLIGVTGRLRVHPRHRINDEHLRYRRDHYRANNGEPAEEPEIPTAGTATHLTPAEAGRLLGKSSHEVRDMLVRGELSQEQVDGRWLIPALDVDRVLNPQRPPAENRQKRPLIKNRGPKNRRKRKSKLRKNLSSNSVGDTETSAIDGRISGLAAEVSYLEKEIERLNDERRRLKSGLMSDEKRRRIKRLQAEKKRKGKKLQELRTELSRQEKRR